MAPTCGSCGAENDEAARFCSACGEALRAACPACGAEHDRHAAFCSSCGAALHARPPRRGTPADEREERRIVSLVFADLAGSTALGERLDPEETRSVQTDLYDVLERHVTRFGGVIEKFVGDAVLAVFGTPVAHGDDPERAVRAALAARDAFERFAARVRERHGVDVALRIGVGTGEVVAGREAAARGELMVSGDPVNTAARLQQLAEPGTVLVGERTYAATHRTIVYGPERSIDARGKSAPLRAWVAEAARPEAGRRGLEGRRTPFVGREGELGVLAAAAERVEREHVPQLVTLLGAAGVGKSRLLAELGERLPGARVAVGRCLAYGDAVTYWPLAEIARGQAGIDDGDDAEVALEKLRRWVTETAPAAEAERVLAGAAWTVGLTLPDSTIARSDDVRSLLHGAWTRLLPAVAGEGLGVVAIEDVHWASDALLDLLDEVFDRLADVQLLLVCTARPELLARRPTWGGAKANALAITLSPLSRGESGRLLAALLGLGGAPGEELAALLDRAEGNPFFLEEIVQMLIEQGALRRAADGWAATERLSSLPLPDSVHGVIAARIDLLESRARDALRRSSVMGREFWPAALGLDDEPVAALVRSGLVLEVPSPRLEGARELAFKHALIRDVAYASLTRAERRLLHRQVAEWIDGAAGDRAAETVEIAAYHYGEAIAYGEDDPVMRRRAFATLLAAGDASLARASPATAEILHRRAAELADDAASKGAALFALGRTEFMADRDPGTALVLLEQAEQAAAEAGDAALRADVLGWLSRVCWSSGRWAQAVASADGAIDALAGAPESPQLARALARRSQLEMLRDDPRAVAHAREAVEVARRVGDSFAEVNARINLFTAGAWAGTPPADGEVFEIARASVAVGAWEEAQRAIGNYLWTAQAYAPLARVEGTVAALQVVVEGLPAAGGIGNYVSLSLAKLTHLPAGRWDDIDACLTEIEPIAASNRMVWTELAGALALARGDVDTATRLVAELVPAAIDSGEAHRILPMTSLALAVACVTGERGDVDTVVAEVLACPPRWPIMLPGAGIAAELHRLGRLGALEAFAGRVRDVEAPLSRHLAVSRAAADGLLALASGDPGRAARLLRDAVGLERQAGCEYRAACLEQSLADAYAAGGDEEEAALARRRSSAVLEPLGVVNPVFA